METESQVTKRTTKPRLFFVIPCYNEETVLSETAPLFLAELEELVGTHRVSDESRILFVNDGSSDATWDVICNLAHSDERIAGMSLSRNRGHQNALFAGLMEAKDLCDIAISIDCDGQDDISAATAMVDGYLEGAEIVYGVRSDRKTDTVFKRVTAEAYYRFLQFMGADVVFNHADYRLMSSKALDALAEYPEVNLFLRGLVPQLGFKTTEVFYERKERVAGESHYPLGKMLALAFDGVTSLSTKPMRFISGAGIAFLIIGLLLAIWAIVTAVTGNAVAGWASTICLMSVLGGLQLFALGVIGEYVAKAYMESKRRPRYIIESRTWK